MSAAIDQILSSLFAARRTGRLVADAFEQTSGHLPCRSWAAILIADVTSALVVVEEAAADARSGTQGLFVVEKVLCCTLMASSSARTGQGGAAITSVSPQAARRVL